MEVIKKGTGVYCECTGHTGHGGLGCGAILAVNPAKDLFRVTSMVPGGDVNKAFKCPECGTTSDFETNQVKIDA
jgi:hypothetical protein